MLNASESPGVPMATPETVEPAPGATLTVPAEVVALATYIVSLGEIDARTLGALMLDLGLVAKVAFDPEAHGEGNDPDLISGDSFLAFTTPMRAAMALGRPHLKGWNGRLN